eukprot:s1389_g3.t1
MLIKLLDAAVDVNRVDNTSATALLTAAEEEDHEAKNCWWKHGLTSTCPLVMPIHLCCLQFSMGISGWFAISLSEVLASTRARVMAELCCTIAAEEKQLDVVQVLLTGGANLQMSSTGETAVDAARRRCSDEAEDLLEISTCVARRPGSERKRKLQLHGDPGVSRALAAIAVLPRTHVLRVVPELWRRRLVDRKWFEPTSPLTF